MTKDRICSATFVHEKDLPAGKKLLTCGRCKETCYVSREAQLEHWPWHKFSCCPIEKDPSLALVQEVDNVASLISLFGWILERPEERVKGRGRALLKILQRLQYLMLETNVEDDMTDPHSVTPFQQKICGERWKVVWAIPGFTQFMCSADFALPETFRRLKDKNLSVTVNRKEHFGAPRDFYFMISTFLTNCIRTSQEEGITSLANAAAQSGMEMWKCKYVRAFAFSVYAEAQSNMACLCNFMTSFFNPMPKLVNGEQSVSTKTVVAEGHRAIELVPGMTAKGFLSMLLQNTELFHLYFALKQPEEYMMNLRGSSRREKDLSDFWPLIIRCERLADLERQSSAWKALTVNDRLELLKLSHSMDSVAFRFQNPNQLMSKDCVVRLIKGIDSTKILLELYHFAIATSKSGDKADTETIEMLWISRELLLVRHRPKVKACFQAIEAAIEQGLPLLPADVFDVLVEYSLPHSIW